MSKGAKFGIIFAVTVILMIAYGVFLFNTMIRKDLEEKKSHVDTPFR